MHATSTDSTTVYEPKPRPFHEDWLLIAVGALVLWIAVLCVSVPSNKESTGTKPTETKPNVINLAKGWFAKLETWKDNPAAAFQAKSKQGEPYYVGRTLLATFAIVGLILLPVVWYKRMAPGHFLIGFSALFLLAVLAFLMTAQEVVKYYNFEYVLWALLLGLGISNTLGVPDWLRPMLMGESLIKLGLVLFGAEVLFGKLVALGPPGIFTSWLVTPVVLITTFWFGQRVLKIASPSLNMVISADMSVCGVSAAIATGAACRAKREEVSYAIGVSLFFTAIMMVVQPYFVLWSGMDKIVGAAWIGGTIDSTGAVVAAGAALDGEGENAAKTVAAAVKMIQNVLIGVIAFGVATYWTVRYGADDSTSRIGVLEIWKRFPKFVLGFFGASLVFSFLPMFVENDGVLADTVGKEITSQIRIWLFCLAFVAFGLETNFRELWKYMAGGKPLMLYVIGQAWSMLLSLAMAYLMFGVLYADKIKAILAK